MKIDFLQHAERRLGFLQRDCANVLQYGWRAPKCCEPIYVPVSEIVGLPLAKKRMLGGKRKSGQVVKGDWPLGSADVVPLNELEKIEHCLQHWVYGVPWSQTGSFEFYRSLPQADVLRRHQKLDEIYAQVQKEGRLRTQKELHPRAFREHNGVRINIGPEGQLVFVDGGTHRLGMAVAAGIEVIVAELGVIHIDALHLLPELRLPPSQLAANQ